MSRPVKYQMIWQDDIREEGREEERMNTEREKRRADAAEKRADAAEAKIKVLEDQLSAAGIRPHDAK